MPSYLQSFKELANELSKIPNIGKKSAHKIAHHLSLDKELSLNIIKKLERAILNIGMCNECGGLSEGDICSICSDESRIAARSICIVSQPKDILTIENAKIFKGTYFVVESLQHFKEEKLKERIIKMEVEEIIFAFTPSMLSETMIIFIEDRLSSMNLSFSKIAHGVPTGVGLDNIDSFSLSSALNARTKT